jgi:DNA replication regulator SLD3
MVMVAKVEGEKNMVVIERIGECVYSMCALNKDVKVKDVRTVAKMAKDTELPVVTEVEGTLQEGNEWWRGMVVRKLETQEKQELSLQFLIQNPAATELFHVYKPNNRPSPDAKKMDITAPVYSRHESAFSADSGYGSSPKESLFQATNSIKSQYLEALYSTKTSLAYFAKSALSRARSEFQRLEQPTQEESLIAFLQNMILKIDDFSAKYENFLPTLINKQCPLVISDEERNHLIQKFRRNGGQDQEVNESALQREINELKIREYAF